MAQSYSGQKRIRKHFGKIREVLEMPNLIQVQKSSYDLFLNSGEGEAPIDGEGIMGVFQSVFPIKDFNETSVLEFVSYELEHPKYDVEECQTRDMTYSAPLKVKLRLIVFDVDEDTGARSVKDIKEQYVFMGDMPLMTPNGTFVVNGTERVIVSQMHRSPGVFFDHDRGKTHSSGKLLFGNKLLFTTFVPLILRKNGSGTPRSLSLGYGSNCNKLYSCASMISYDIFLRYVQPVGL